MINYSPVKATFVSDPTQNQPFRVYYRITANPDVPASYIEITDNMIVLPDGSVQVPRPILNGLVPDTQYTFQFEHRLDSSNIVQKTVRTPKEYAVGDNPLKMRILYPGQTVDIVDTGLLTSSLPENHASLYFLLERNFQDAYAGFANAIPHGSRFTTKQDFDGVPPRRETGYDMSDGRYVELNNEHPDPDARVNMETLCAADGSRFYTRFVTFYFDSDDYALANMYLYFSGTDTDYVCAYIDTAANVKIEHCVGGVVQRSVSQYGVLGKKWFTLEMRYNGTAADTFFFLYSNGFNIGFTTMTAITSQPAGDPDIPVLIGTRDRTTTSENLIVKRFYNEPTYVTDNNQLYHLRSYLDYLPKLRFHDTVTSANYDVPYWWMLKLDNSLMSTSLPPDMPVSNDYVMYVVTSTGERTHIFVQVIAFTVRSSGFDVNFGGDFNTAMTAFKNLFYGFRSQWGGVNGGVNPELIYGQRDKAALIFEMHGDNYAGTIVGVQRGTEADAVHNIPADPLYGEPWISRVGAIAVTQDYLGYGEMSVTMRLPSNIRGVAPALWFFHYQEYYPSDPRWDTVIDTKGVHPYGNDYVVVNNEIDIEFPSHLIQAEFATWAEQATSYFLPAAMDTKFHIGIANSEPTPSKRGLFRLTNPASPNLFSSWVKEADTYQPRYQPSFNHCKFNNWIGERGGGGGWSYVESDFEGEEYLALLTELSQTYADDQDHVYTIKWFKDRTELWIDGVSQRVNRAFVPYNGMRFTIGPWFPSAPDNAQPWLPNPMLTWAGYPADWEAMQIQIKRIQYTPYDSGIAGGTVELTAETYPDAGLRVLSIP